MGFVPDSVQQVTDRIVAGYEAELATAAPDGVDASSASAPFAGLARVQGQAVFGTHLHVSATAADFFVDTCREDLVPAHAARRGLAQAPAQAAAGFAEPPAGSTPGLVIPSGVTLGGGAYVITAATTLNGGGTASVPIAAVAAGIAGNLAPGTVLPLDSPVAGLAAQNLTVDADGITGGSEQETLAELRARTIAAIRRPARGGAPGDYTTWIQNLYPLATYIAEKPLWTGLGTVGVIVAFSGGRAATTTEVSRIRAELALRRPLTVVELTVLSATIVPVPLTLAIDPDTVTVRAAVTEAYAAFLAAEPGIGGTIDYSRLRAALSSASGEYRHRLASPTSDQVMGTTELAVPGSITWQSWT